jgi:predicted dithiol-disulfide oxidoreductase (DUF899 family)
VRPSNVRHKVVSREEWLQARRELLLKEKALTRQYDAVAAERRELPWIRVTKEYVFDAEGGWRTLADLFGNCSQLIVDHFMLGPGWKEGCVGCSFGADHVDGTLVHLAHRDVAFVAVSRAPLAEIEAFRKRMGWRFEWVSSYESDFNRDFGVSFVAEEAAHEKVFYNYELREFHCEDLPGRSVFFKDENEDIFHTYSTFARGCESALATYMLLDLVPKGRGEAGLSPPMAWVRHHDRYPESS